MDSLSQPRNTSAILQKLLKKVEQLEHNYSSKASGKKAKVSKKISNVTIQDEANNSSDENINIDDMTPSHLKVRVK